MASCLRSRTSYHHNEPPMSTFLCGENIEAGMAVAKSKKSRSLIIKADCNDPDRMPCIGALYENKLMGQEGEVIHFGLGVNLKRIADFDTGQYIYPSSTAGYFTKTQPTEGEIQIVGIARDECSAILFGLPPLTTVIPGYSQTGNHTITIANGTNEIAFATDFSCWRNGILYVDFDMSALLADNPITVVGRLYHKVDGTNLKRAATNWWNSAIDDPVMHLSAPVTTGTTIQLSLQCSKAVGASRVVNHVFIMET